MRVVRAIVVVATLCVSGCATPGTNGPLAVAARASPPAYPELQRFDSETAFVGYLREVRRIERLRQQASRRVGGGKQDAVEEPCPPEMGGCAEEDSIVVTGSRLSRSSFSAAPTATTSSTGGSITNVQNVGVDEGDIVKQIGRFLIVLQDGRLFVVDTRPDGPGLALVDRADVYRHRGADVWYDEMLTHGNRLVVTGFNYGENATEYSVFSIDDNGQLTREGAYFISSDDYYDTENYATRLVDGNLVIYTPLNVSGFDVEQAPRWPLVRRWLRAGEDDDVISAGRPLFDARDIHQPIQATLSPTVHTFSICPLGSTRAGDELDCRTTAIVGPPAREFYVSTSHIYLWTWDRYGESTCAAHEAGSFEAAAPAALFQISLLNPSQPQAMFVRGHPYDQLSMEAADGEFRALAVWSDENCDDYDAELVPMRYFRAPLYAFSTRPERMAAHRFAGLPAAPRHIENRFTDDYLVYGGRGRYGAYPPHDEKEPISLTGHAVIVPVRAPDRTISLPTPHSIIRVERAGDNAVLTGYRDAGGLSLSLVDLRGAPRIASTATLQARYESEGRSHAFNSSINADGSGLMGIPSVERRGESGRWWWRSESSDVSFLSVDAAGNLNTLGALVAHEDSEDPKYRCEVSCIDWYGNSRPIFTDGRVFALSGTEMIEGVIANGQIEERRRVNLTRSPRSAPQPAMSD
jgi:hypothetical protein